MSKIIQPQGPAVRTIEIKMDAQGRSMMVAKDALGPGGMMTDLVQMQILSQMLAAIITRVSAHMAEVQKRGVISTDGDKTTIEN
jgi:hypothetical protein